MAHKHKKVPFLGRSPEFMARRFNGYAAQPESKAEEILAHLAVRPGAAVADVGAGGGYFALRFADLVGAGGIVYAVDIQWEFLHFIEASAEKAGIRTIRTIQAEEDDPNLPAKSVDLVFMRNAFHHLGDPEAYFTRLRPALRPGGRVAVIEHKRHGMLNFVKLFGHYTPEGAIVEILRKAGFKPAARYDFLKKQSFTVFTPEPE